MTNAAGMVTGEQVGGAVVGAAVVGAAQAGVSLEETDPLAAMDDGFNEAALASKWTVYEGDGTASISVSGGELNLTCNAGGTNDSLWFDGDEGILVYQLVTGDFDAVATVRVRNLANSGLPTVGDGNYRIAGLAAHDPDRSSLLNYVHVGLGCTASAGITCEWKTTESSVSTYNSVAAATGVGQIRILRVDQIFSLYYRAAASDAWTLVQSIDRGATTPLPSTLQLGFMVYASVASHDERIFVDRFTVRTP